MLLSRRAYPRRRPARLQVEALEERALPSVTLLVPPDLHPTVDQAQGLAPAQGNDLDAAGPATVLGTIDAASGVDWYCFTLSAASHVTLSLGARDGSSFTGTVSLYNQDPDAFGLQFDANSNVGPNDPYNPLGYRLLQQVQGTAGKDAQIGLDLAAGTYYFAVSGAGNAVFNPLLAGSGYDGSTGAYQAV
ncbi:MAG TPA: hypothetical protein VFA26_08555, partial [Gemmataceae bacterium]|nr:hypothetical protein [Gemmataceae bacterium]